MSLETIRPWLGDLNQVTGMSREAVGLVCILVSVLCGAVIGWERERRDKPAGLRTLVLICVGSTIFTIVSLLLASQKQIADPARLAAQIIPGIGFLGAGAIIQSRFAVRGLTTGATIWTVAAVGVTIGTGHIAAGVVFTAIILGTLTLLQRLEHWMAGPCRLQAVTLAFRANGGKGNHRIRFVLDRYRVPDARVRDVSTPGETNRVLLAQLCVDHREHRAVLRDLAELDEVVSIDVDEATSV